MPLPSDFPFFLDDTDNDEAKKPGSWLKHLECTWTATTFNTDKIYALESLLDADSPAEDWWDYLDRVHKTTANMIEMSSVAKRVTMM
jgi:hypothetical protein